MIKKFIIIVLVAIISYYAGTKSLTINDFLIFIDEKNLEKIFFEIIDKTKDFFNEKI